MKEIYFDNSATTKVSEKAAETAVRAMREDFGNPSSVHSKGAAAFHALNEARSAFAQYLDVMPSELYFTSCGMARQGEYWFLLWSIPLFMSQAVIYCHAGTMLHTCRLIRRASFN